MKNKTICKFILKSYTVGILFLVFSFACVSQSESSQTLYHDLRVKIIPSEQRIIGSDRISVIVTDGNPLLFTISQSATVKKVTIGGRNTSYQLKDGTIAVSGEIPGETPATIEIDYEAIFNDPYPETPVNSDNPGYGVTGIISGKGVFLLAGAGWYPEIPGSTPKFSLRVETPLGFVPVTAGKRVKTIKGKLTATYHWHIDHPLDGLSLSAAAYGVDRIEKNGIEINTYFLEQNRNLSSTYLDTSVEYLSFYEHLFGKYPFAKFSVVENFFPTGYGFSSYTLIGSRILQLPFIPYTSLPHEIAHCWWGNGVWVDYSEGNWSEGLTTYVADYLLKEKSSDETAEKYRRQMIRNYTSLVPPEKEFPLSRFLSRFDPISKAIGYDKSAMVFHMLRRNVGDPVFWEALREIYRSNQFQRVSWKDIRKVFENYSQKDLKLFFDQWVYQAGAPELTVDRVTVNREDERWRVTGIITQKSSVYDLPLTLLLKTQQQDLISTVFLEKRGTSFTFFSLDPPVAIIGDPKSDVLRRLDYAEIPPSVNSIKSASELTIVLGDKASEGSESIVKLLMQSLGVDRYEIIHEKEFLSRNFPKTDLLLVGLPADKTSINRLSKDFSLTDRSFTFRDKDYLNDGYGFFGVFRHPGSPRNVMAVFMPGAKLYRESVARKITHYGKYGYLLFADDRNVVKGLWPVTQSPLWYAIAPENELDR